MYGFLNTWYDATSKELSALSELSTKIGEYPVTDEADKKNEEKETRFLTTRQVAKQLSVSPNFIRGQIHKGTLKAIQLGTDFRIRLSDLEDFILRSSTSPSPSPSPEIPPDETPD